TATSTRVSLPSPLTTPAASNSASIDRVFIFQLPAMNFLRIVSSLRLAPAWRHADVTLTYESPVRQSISDCPHALSVALILENGLLPKNPLCADSGDGFAASRIV